MAWELEHQELVGVDDAGRRPLLRRRLFPTKKMLLYGGLALVPIALFVVMLLLARR